MYRWLTAALLYALVAVASVAEGSFVLENFESGSFSSGWIKSGTSGTSWTVGDATGTSPNILPPEGEYFARSGEPNRASGDSAGPAEADVGILTSPAFTVGYTNLEWFAAGWSGETPSSPVVNYFEILDGTGTLLTQVPVPYSDNWTTKSVNLISIGLSPGEKFRFQAVDGSAATAYGWLAFDNLRFTGNAVFVVPELGNLVSALVVIGLGLALKAATGGLPIKAQR